METSDVEVIEYIELSSDGDVDLADSAEARSKQLEGDVGLGLHGRDRRLIERDKLLLDRHSKLSKKILDENSERAVALSLLNECQQSVCQVPRGSTDSGGLVGGTLRRTQPPHSEILIGYIGGDEFLLKEVAGLYVANAKRSGDFNASVKLISMQSLQKAASVLKRYSLDILVAEAVSVSSCSQGGGMSELLTAFYQVDLNRDECARSCPLLMLLGERGGLELHDPSVIQLSKSAFRVLKKSTDPRRIAQAFDSAIRVNPK